MKILLNSRFKYRNFSTKDLFKHSSNAIHNKYTHKQLTNSFHFRIIVIEYVPLLRFFQKINFKFSINLILLLFFFCFENLLQKMQMQIQ